MRSHRSLADGTFSVGDAATSMVAVAEVFKAAAHPVRAQILDLLCRGESSIAELCEGAGVEASHLSRHLTQMRAQRLIQGRRVEGRLVYRLAYAEVAHLLDAARSILHAQAAAAPVRQMDYARPSYRMAPPFAADAVPPPTPGDLRQSTFSEEQLAALESTLASRAVIGDACAAIAARTGFTVDAAAKLLIITAHENNITLRDAASRELENPQDKPKIWPAEPT